MSATVEQKNYPTLNQRGRTGSATKSISVVAYEPPSIKKLLVTRCNADGTENFEGEYGLVEFEAVVSTMSGQNTADYSVTYVPSSATGGETQALTDYKNNFSPSGSVIIPMSSSHAYDVTLTATDAFTSIELKTTASTGFSLIHFGADGRTMAFGKISEHSGEAEFGLPIRLTGGLVHIPLPDDQDFNELTAPGFYGGSAGSYTHCPFSSGTMLVAVHSLGTGEDLIQIVTSQYATYNQSLRRMRKSGVWTSWYDDLPNAVIPPNKGGTGLTSPDVGSILVGNGTTAMTKLLGTGALFAEESGKPKFGTLPISAGGTGSATAEGALQNIGAAAADHQHTVDDIEDIEHDVVPIPCIEQSFAGDGADPAALAVTVDLFLDHFVNDYDLAAVKPELAGDHVSRFLIGQFFGVTGAGKFFVVCLPDVLLALVGLPLQLPIQLGFQIGDFLVAILDLGHQVLLGFHHRGTELGDLLAAGFADALDANAVLPVDTERILVAVELVVGFLDLIVLFCRRLEAGAFGKLAHHHFSNSSLIFLPYSVIIKEVG